MIARADLAEVIAYVFDAPALRHLGIAHVAHGEGTCEAALDVREHHLQQDGFVHAGVQATLADHTAGAAATTVTAPGQRVLTAEFKINLLRPARGTMLACTARVLKAGRTLIVVESDVVAHGAGAPVLTARALVTIVPLTPAG